MRNGSKPDHISYVLSINLMYPAVLGTILYSILDYIKKIGDSGHVEWWNEAKIIGLFILLAIHFAYDFLDSFYYKQRGYVYYRWQWLLDSIILVCLYFAFSELSKGNALADSRRFSVLLAGVYLAFALFDYSILNDKIGKSIGIIFERWYDIPILTIFVALFLLNLLINNIFYVYIILIFATLRKYILLNCEIRMKYETPPKYKHQKYFWNKAQKLTRERSNTGDASTAEENPVAH